MKPKSKIPKKSSTSKGAANVFKTIKTEVKKSDRKQKRRRSNDKKGGGRQPQSKKLDRRKYLEYKYAARELLTMMQSVKNTAQISLVRFGQRVNVQVSMKQSNSSIKKKQN